MIIEVEIFFTFFVKCCTRNISGFVFLVFCIHSQSGKGLYRTCKKRIMARNVPLFLLYKTFFLFSQHRNRQLFNLVFFEAKTAMIAECRILSCNVIGIKKTENGIEDSRT